MNSRDSKWLDDLRQRLGPVEAMHTAVGEMVAIEGRGTALFDPIYSLLDESLQHFAEAIDKSPMRRDRAFLDAFGELPIIKMAAHIDISVLRLVIGAIIDEIWPPADCKSLDEQYWLAEDVFDHVCRRYMVYSPYAQFSPGDPVAYSVIGDRVILPEWAA